MKHSKSLWPVLFLVAVSASAHAAAGDEGDLLREEAALCHAFEVGDAAGLRARLDPTFTQTTSRGEVTDFAQNVAEVVKRDPAYEVFRNHDQKVRMYGDAAVILGVTTVKGHSGSTAFDADFQYTDTWIHRDGRWKIVASHATRLSK